MTDPALVKRIRLKYRSLSDMMDERMRRQWAASEAADLGWGGVSTVARATGLARNTIMVGARELEHRREHPKEAIRKITAPKYKCLSVYFWVSSCVGFTVLQ